MCEDQRFVCCCLRPKAQAQTSAAKLDNVHRPYRGSAIGQQRVVPKLAKQRRFSAGKMMV